LGIQVGETTADGLITIEAVTCLAGCDRAPMFQIQSNEGLEYHENMSVDKTMELVEALKQVDKGVK
jgi:NADH-quinone oxidoreductase subunit E